MNGYSRMICWILLGFFFKISSGRPDIWLNIPCNKYIKPNDCDINKSEFTTVEQLDRCGPAGLTVNARNYFLASSGRGITYKDNKDAFDRIRIQPKMLRDVSRNSIETTVLGLKVDFPIGLSPVAMHKLASKDGELDTVRGLCGSRTVMILSSFSSTRVEEVARAADEGGGRLHLWQQLYIFRNRSVTVDLVRRAERSGVKALVLTADSPEDASVSCDARVAVRIPDDVRKTSNMDWSEEYDPAANFAHISWLKTITKLPIIVKGILSGRDALQAVKAGATAILVSNHGGRQMDGVLATIDALPGVVKALRGLQPPREVYLDGGVRSGHDVFKAIARGAKMVFVGRPQIWSLAFGGSEGIRKMMNIFKNHFNQTMLIAGANNVTSIGPEYLVNPQDIIDSF